MTMKIVVGLGNPGNQYKQTRHNVGFDVIAHLAQRYGVARPKAKFNAEVVELIVENEKTVLISPLTFMNLSGQSVRAAVDFYKIELSDLMIVCDDISLDVGRLRMRSSGSDGGQNGLKDIIQKLGTNAFPRLRVGVGKVPSGWDTSNFVLGKFDSDERIVVDRTVAKAGEAIEVWVRSGIQVAMNRFNTNLPKQPKKRPLEAESDEQSHKAE